MSRFSISNKLRDIINEIDVTDSNYEKATNRYNSISNFIYKSNLNQYNPEIYIHGSFKLGTAIQPITESGAYDIDIVCTCSKINKEQITQSKLKNIFGSIINEYATSLNMKNPPEESNRCWTLNYVDENNFHVDILPSLLFSNEQSTVISITDKRNENYYKISNDWDVSNPKGYAQWFKIQSSFLHYKEYYMNNFASGSSIEDVPDYKIKTPLQKIIQLLKRHAEVMFSNDIKFKPSSIIITTLIAGIYPQYANISNNFEELLNNLIKNMHLGIKIVDGNPCVLNPVNENENLSLKWMNDEEYYISFCKWIDQVNTDFGVENKEISFDERLFYIRRSLFIDNKTEIGIPLESLNYHKKPSWFMNLSQKVSIKVMYSKNAFRNHEIKSGEILYKYGDLKFEVLTNNINDFNIFWQITNTGSEAKNAGSLRGDFYESELVLGKKVRTERTLYTGRHYVEAFIVKNNICYGKSKPFEINIGGSTSNTN